MTMPRAVAIGGAILAIIAFFLPWVQYANATYSGAGLAAAIGPATAALKAGGIKGFDIGLYLVPVLAGVSIVLTVLSSRAAAPESESRLRILATAVAIAGLAVTLLFLGSAVLGGAPDIAFQPGHVATDLSVTTSVAKALNAGAYVSVGIGVFLVILGFLASAIGGLLGRTTDPAAARVVWRTQDFVLLAIIAVVFGAIYWAWLAPYLWVEGVAAQPGAELFFAIWFTSGLLGGYILRRPGAAFLAETLTAAAEVLIGAPAGPILLITGMMEALGAELVFAATGYRRWGWPTMLIAGVAAAIVALPWNWFRLGYFALDPALLVALLGVRVIAGLLAGAAAKLLGDAIAATGSLNAYALGRERVREV
ncbi:MAG: ECF transporter S component [Chloroflexota bacterium]|nr:ECF transporter S component [Chloroflexota bacterium]